MNDELKKCLLCKNAFCNTCPAATAIPHAIELIRAGKTEQAAAELFDNNPLSAITGAVCPNHLYCHGNCILSRKGKGVDFGKIERVVSAQYLDTLIEKTTKNQKTQNDKSGDQQELNRKKILIIGSGPAGLSLAYYLKKAGHDICVYERENMLGGMLRYGIPDFRLDKTLIDKLTKVLANMGIEFKTNTAADLNNIEKYKENFDIIVIAIGACISRRLGIEGESQSFVTHALEYLKAAVESAGNNTNDINVSDTADITESAANMPQVHNVIIIGGGNVAIDCALTAATQYPAASVTLCYRRNLEDMKAYPEEIEMVREKNIKMNFQMVPKKITENGVIFQRGSVTVENSAANKSNKDDTEIFMPADKVIIAIGQSATENGLIKTDGFKTETENIYAIGDAVTGTSTIIKAVAAAKELAKII